MQIVGFLVQWLISHYKNFPMQHTGIFSAVKIENFHWKNLTFLIYEGHSISNAILIVILCLNTLLKFDLFFLKHKFNLYSARLFNS